MCMQMNNKVFNIWTQFEQNRQKGMVKRLYTSDSAINVYCIYQHPEEHYGIALSFPKSIKFNGNPFSNLSELNVSLYEDTSFKNSWLLCATITDRDKKSEFSYMCENIIQTVLKESNIKSAVATFANTLIKWKNLFDKVRTGGLSREEQQGLYGELCMLHKFIENTDDLYSSVNYYIGTDKALRDFQGRNWAVEVKTTATNNPQLLKINGERQLDDTIIEQLFLFHCSVESSKMSGETLPDKVRSIRSLLSSDLAALSLFNSKMFEAGYLDAQEIKYLEQHYKIRKECFYSVKGNFPRIRENELRPGVGNVQYGITISDCEPYIVSEMFVLNNTVRS